MTLQAHASAILTRLNTSLVAYDAKVPDPTPDPKTNPYAVVHFAFLTLPAEQAPDKVALPGDSDVVQVDAYIHSVGGSAQAARAVATRVRTQLQNWRPVISGRACFPVRHIENVPADTNETTGVTVVDIADVYRLVSVPA